ncbi:disease resistance protein RPS5-like [Amborella trichopoda]|uniref:disease resistance protein RPS5-like n=1 Tax=Amborella trichopoda TaxID=13333 RepID=UPI0009BEDA0F|nr:disease resistance protein RPS5-like [Amborella trichopoda]|eukprot:XP_020524902.1 disease resistance protein RPS5-like [Amborella trichopoda]
METSTIEDQPSVRDMLQKVLDCICDQRYGIIGVYRMGGVGKTTLMAKVNNSFKSNPYFDIVIMVIVSAYPNVTKIENRIGERLGLDLSSGDEEAARHKLLGASKRKKYLLILDDLWQEDEIGIPQPKNESGCKILVTSRNQYVSTEMGTEFTIEVKKFSVSESWSLFVAKAGQHVISPSIKPHAKIIVRKCEGLPLAIITIAHAMANRDTVREWEDAIRELRQSASSLRGMKDKVFDSLKFSYDRLESDLHKLFFLFCALYPEDYSISQYELAIHCLGEGLVDRLGSLKATQNKVAALVGSLRTSCMLENGEGEGEGEVRMHDMMRKLALWITSLESKDNLKFLVRARASLKEAPEATEWKEVDIISLMGNELEDLPKLSECCPKLVTLLLHENFTLKSIPSSSFFEYMECLRVLNLSYTRIESVSLVCHL